MNNEDCVQQHSLVDDLQFDTQRFKHRIKTWFKFAIPINLAVNDRLDTADGWLNETRSLVALEARLSEHIEIPAKEFAKAFVPGRIEGDQRKNSAVTQIDFLVYDADRGTDVEALIRRIKEQGYRAIIYSTYSHLATETQIKLDAYQAFTKSNEVTVEGLRAYLANKKHYPPAIVDSVEIANPHLDTEHGVVCVAHHAPLAKCRVVLPLRRPFKRSEQARFEQMWKAKYEAVAATLGLDFDRACSSVAHAFYFPSCPPNAQPFAQAIHGDLLDLDTVALPADQKADAETAHSKAEHHYHGYNLDAWIAQYGATFRIEDALRRSGGCPAGLFRKIRDEGGVHIQCPFEDEHSEPGGNGTFVANADAAKGSGFRIHCCHDSCLTRRGDGTSIDRLAFILRLLEEGWLSIADLQNTEFGGGPISMRRYDDARFSAKTTSSRAVDRDGNGIDLAVFHAQIIAKGLFDYDHINALCGTQIADDVTVEQLVGFIEQGVITRAQLAQCANLADQTAETDPYAQKMRELVAEVAAGTVSARDKDARLDAIGKEFNVRRKALEQDYERHAQEAAKSETSRIWRLGFLSPEETALIAPTRGYAQRLAIVNMSGQSALLDMHQPDISKAIMAPKDFELIERRNWIEVADPSGQLKTIYPAKEFLRKPPKEVRVFGGGFVFKPQGTVAAGEYNLYRGLGVTPDSSGSCSEFHALLRKVWAGDDEEVFNWVLEYLMHVIAHPGEKVGTSLAIHGGQGDGKSIVFEVCMASILGDMLLRVTNPNLVLGDFNESLVGKLLITLEEAAFVGNKPAFERLKDLITGRQVTINAKFKAPFTVDNHARMVVISNHDHYLQLEPDDRRCTVLESNASWKGTNRFERLMHQWHNGGAARFVHDALTHSFRRMQGRDALVISTNLKTEVAIEQMAQSRSALERCIVELLLTGDLTGRDARWEPPDQPYGVSPTQGLWPWEGPVELQTMRLVEAVRRHLADTDPIAARRETGISQITRALERYAGGMPKSRPKQRDQISGRRIQGPTIRELPPRGAALLHALRAGLITADEFHSAKRPL